MQVKINDWNEPKNTLPALYHIGKKVYLVNKINESDGSCQALLLQSPITTDIGEYSAYLPLQGLERCPIGFSLTVTQTD